MVFMIRLAPNIGQNPRVLTSVNVMCIYANNLGGEVERGCVKQVDCRRAEHRESAKMYQNECSYNTRVNLSRYWRQRSVSSVTLCVRVECFISFSTCVFHNHFGHGHQTEIT